MLVITQQTFDCLEEDTFATVYKSLVRIILEYGHSVWQPHHKMLYKDTEQVQRSATRLLSHFKDKPYSDKLRHLNLLTLERRRRRVVGVVRGFLSTLTNVSMAFHHHHQSLNREGRWGTTNDFATSFLHFSLLSTALWELPNSRPLPGQELPAHNGNLL